GRQRLAREDEYDRCVAKSHNTPVGFHDLVRITRSQRDQPGDGTEGSKMFDGLVSRAIFAITHGVVRENEKSRQFHKGREPNGWARIINEDEKASAKAAQLRERQTID